VSNHQRSKRAVEYDQENNKRIMEVLDRKREILRKAEELADLE